MLRVVTEEEFLKCKHNSQESLDFMKRFGILGKEVRLEWYDPSTDTISFRQKTNNGGYTIGTYSGWGEWLKCVPKYKLGDIVRVKCMYRDGKQVLTKIYSVCCPMHVGLDVTYDTAIGTLKEEELEDYVNFSEQTHQENTEKYIKDIKKENKEKMKDYKIGNSVYTKLMFGGTNPEVFSNLIKSVHFNDEKFTTTVVLIDGSVGMSTCMQMDVDSYDRYSGFAIALMNALFGSKTSARKFIQESIEKQDKIDTAKKKAKVKKSYRRREEEMEHDDNFTSDYPTVRE